MEQNINTIIIGLNLDQADFNYSMEELEQLTTANHLKTVGKVTQKLPHPEAATYFGKGKVEEVAQLVVTTNASTIIANDELSPSQIRNLEKATNATVMDRTGLILEIFATRAHTREAKLQVELAKLKYQLPRLRTGASQHLDQQSAGGGLANRGTGETKLELNRRTIEHQINHVRHELKESEQSHATQRKRRAESHLKTVALVGYTNAGKSTIMNQLVQRFGENEDKQVFVKNMLFATLDTSVRKLELPGHRSCLLSDTVGFVSKLPHQLVAAFQSTLSEAAQADLLLQVVDYSDPNQALMMETTNATLQEIGVPELPMITVFNKADLAGTAYPIRTGHEIIISAKDEHSIDLLVETITTQLFADEVVKSFTIPFADGAVVESLNRQFAVQQTDYTEAGTVLTVRLPQAAVGRYQKYLTSN
ncbi:GTP-binding protein HflX [Fructilactobacillus florum 8D]|uniref:GTPase HflX n=1 Tax=Fructilactobacillus florum 8D TaxID=1221538 RepID=W9EHT3_9LACO|nr:GTPase HflX [Fructilactobacillus florum]EKK20578.1 GTP-binding protein HflX [Fructilactobacillus florum 2F]ETO40816.1 GTP-binding protein HflX [Fructilactobacillus florum 8D]